MTTWSVPLAPNRSPCSDVVAELPDTFSPGKAGIFHTLVVDDDPTSRRLLVRMLEQTGHAAIEAASAEQALALFAATHPDLVLMDVLLPGMSGCRAMREMKRLRAPQWLPVILVSSADSDDEVLTGLRAGADDYLTKPLKLSHVLAKVQSMSRSLLLQGELRHSLTFASAIIDHVADALLCCDESGVVRTSNQAAEGLFRCGKDELCGRELSKLVSRNLGDSPGRLAPRTLATAWRLDGTACAVELRQTLVEQPEGGLTVFTLRDVTEQLREEQRMLNDAARLRQYQQALEAENVLARELLERLQLRRGANVPGVQSFTQAAEGFSGDAVVSVCAASGCLYVMLADATGHGLTAAISLVPALSILHAMAARGCSLTSIAVELNDKMAELLPTGRFLAAALLCVDPGKRRGQVWVGGVPAVLLLGADGKVRHRFESTHLAFGVDPSSGDTGEVTAFSWDEPSQLLLCSDGVLEAEGPDGDFFGEPGVLCALSGAPVSDRLGAIAEALHNHLAGLASTDDASVALVDLS